MLNDPMRVTMHHRKDWKFAVSAGLALLIIVITLDLFLYSLVSSFVTHGLLEFLEIVLTSFLFFDILLNLNEAKNKYSFIQRNLLRIIAVFPFALFFRALWLLELEALMSPILLGEWLPGFTNFQKVIKLERSMNFVNRVREFAL